MPLPCAWWQRAQEQRQRHYPVGPLARARATRACGRVLRARVGSVWLGPPAAQSWPPHDVPHRVPRHVSFCFSAVAALLTSKWPFGRVSLRVCRQRPLIVGRKVADIAGKHVGFEVLAVHVVEKGSAVATRTRKSAMCAMQTLHW